MKESNHEHPLGLKYPPVPIQQTRLAIALSVTDATLQVFQTVFQDDEGKRLYALGCDALRRCREAVKKKYASKGAERAVQSFLDSLADDFTTDGLDKEQKAVTWVANMLLSYTLFVDCLATCPDFVHGPRYTPDKLEGRYRKAFTELEEALRGMAFGCVEILPDAESLCMVAYSKLGNWHGIYGDLHHA